MRAPPTTSPSNEYNNARNYGIRPGGFNRRGPRGNFVPPIRNNNSNTSTMAGSRMPGKGDDGLEDSTRKWYVVIHTLVWSSVLVTCCWHGLFYSRTINCRGLIYQY